MNCGLFPGFLCNRIKLKIAEKVGVKSKDHMCSLLLSIVSGAMSTITVFC